MQIAPLAVQVGFPFCRKVKQGLQGERLGEAYLAHLSAAQKKDHEEVYMSATHIKNPLNH